VRSMREFLILVVHLLVTFAKLLRPGGARAVLAESLLLKHQLLISNRSRQRAPNLTSNDLCSANNRAASLYPACSWLRITCSRSALRSNTRGASLPRPI